jgi:hypothetical protein
MNAAARRVPLLMLAAAILAVAPTSVAQSPADSPGSPSSSNVSQLVAFVPPSATSVGFTDWGRIKASVGAQDVTGASPVEDKVTVGMSTAKGEALASGFGIAHLRDHYATWAFDAMDLDWEATIQGDGPPLFVLRFRDDFDLAPVAALFDQRGFSTTTVPGGTIRSHEMVLHEDWLRKTEFAILNTAFLDDGRTLVLSGDVDQVRDVVAHHGTYPDDPALDATAATLDGASAALLLPGLATCQAFTPLPFGIGDGPTTAPPSLTVTGLHPYAALGVGYGRPDWSPSGRIAFAYLDAATARADLPERLALATDGVSQLTGQPYRDALLQVTGSHVDDANLTLDVAPVNDMPRHLFDMVFTRDMAFAGC